MKTLNQRVEIQIQKRPQDATTQSNRSYELLSDGPSELRQHVHIRGILYNSDPSSVK